MRREFLLFAAAGLMAALLALPAPGQAQVSADQLNKLSLEALTAPPPMPPRRAYSPQRRTMNRLYRATMRGAPPPIKRQATTSRSRRYTRS